MSDKITIELNLIESKMIENLLATGLFGETNAEIVTRILDSRLQELVAQGIFVTMPAYAGKGIPGAATLSIHGTDAR